MSFRLALIASFCVLLLLPQGFSQTKDIRIGLIFSVTGQASPKGQAQARSLGALESWWQEDTLAQRIDFISRNDESKPDKAADLARELVEKHDVHALICCTQQEATNKLAAIADELNVLILSPSQPSDERSRWQFFLEPDTERMLQSIILRLARDGRSKLGVMTLDNRFGDDVLTALERLLVPKVMELSVSERYPPNIQHLTPEALWVATRQPEAVLVWGLQQDSTLAYEALRKRGYELSVIVHPKLLEFMSEEAITSLEGAFSVVSPLDLIHELTPGHPSYGLVHQYRDAVAALYGTELVTREGAYVFDALHILREMLGRALVYGVLPENSEAFREAARDALISAEPFAASMAIYSFRENNHLGVDPVSWPYVQLKNGRAHAVP